MKQSDLLGFSDRTLTVTASDSRAVAKAKLKSFNYFCINSGGLKPPKKKIRLSFPIFSSHPSGEMNYFFVGRSPESRGKTESKFCEWQIGKVTDQTQSGWPWLNWRIDRFTCSFFLLINESCIYCWHTAVNFVWPVKIGAGTVSGSCLIGIVWIE